MTLYVLWEYEAVQTLDGPVLGVFHTRDGAVRRIEQEGLEALAAEGIVRVSEFVVQP